MQGLIHVYHGDGKGKTTAAMGLAMRAVVCEKKVVIVQFLKDGKSSELELLKDKASVISGKIFNGFSWNMTEEDKKNTYNLHNEFLEKALSLNPEVLILDELCSVCNLALIDVNFVQNMLKNNKNKMEIVITGRNPKDFMLEYADYVTEMKKVKHPFDNGVPARKGIEF